MTTSYVGPNGQWVTVADTPAEGGTLHFVATPPVNANDPGGKNQFSYDGSYIYICVADNTWVRAAVASW